MNVYPVTYSEAMMIMNIVTAAYYVMDYALCCGRRSISTMHCKLILLLSNVVIVYCDVRLMLVMWWTFGDDYLYWMTVCLVSNISGSNVSAGSIDHRPYCYLWILFGSVPEFLFIPVDWDGGWVGLGSMATIELTWFDHLVPPRGAKQKPLRSSGCRALFSPQSTRGTDCPD